jgi:hypothetical protein
MTNHTPESALGSDSTETPRGLTRRQVAVGAAWAAPVIALAVATPLAAASTPIVPGNPATYPDASFSSTTQLVGDPSLSATGNTAFARTTFIAVSEDESGLASYKAGWSYVVKSTVPFTNVTFDTSTLADQGLTNVGGVYTQTFLLTVAAEQTWVRVKPTAVGQSIQFILTNTDNGTVVGEATATSKA